MIANFRGEYFFLSNFYPFVMEYNGLFFNTVEAAFQSQKTTDPNKMVKFASIIDPNEAKRLGRKVELRPDWEGVKLQIMHKILKIKFSDPILKEKLNDTGIEELIEGNTWGDRYWGAVLKDGKWEGQNWLGRLLMQIRQQI